jgi:hypothetical protein
LGQALWRREKFTKIIKSEGTISPQDVFLKIGQNPLTGFGDELTELRKSRECVYPMNNKYMREGSS